ncbi:MAG: ATP-dependent DNA helicase [Candidatus Woesearchaeota archaeon]|nr:ATP-dependent DNA helicase [Candidatus Woesearchaeota archaeon]
MDPQKLKDVLFPYDAVRDVQGEMMDEVRKIIEDKKDAVLHAPTGLGKTAAALGPALAYALKYNKTVFFLTARHTQHVIALDTLEKIKKKHDVNIKVADMIGKKWMCLQQGVDRLSSGEFVEYCKSLREDKLCDFFLQTRKKMNGELTPEAKRFLGDSKNDLLHTEGLKKECSACKLCPYEMGLEIAKKAQVIVADYYYVFHPSVRDRFLEKIGKKLEDCIVIIDEGHNLTDRIRELLTEKLTSFIMRGALKEAKERELDDLIPKISLLQDVLIEFGKSLQIGGEKLVGKEDFVNKVKAKLDYDELIEDLEHFASMVKESKKKSFLGSVADFLKAWRGEEDGFSRIVSLEESKREAFLSLQYKCLDPATLAEDIIKSCHSAILMSGTLMPTEMYRDLLGFPDDTVEKTFPSPFSVHNRIGLIIPGVTTRYAARGEQQYKKMAEGLRIITSSVPGNTAIFFPSYYLKDEVAKHFIPLCEKSILEERQGLTKEEKVELLDEFKKFKDSGAVLLGVTSGSFGEGIDLPGDLLKCVVVVGIPLGRPNLETKQVIDYYNKKFGRGWDYGYVLPAITKVFQNAGRCIRSETDRGVIVYMDERYAWPSYARVFPEDEVEVCVEVEERIEGFFLLKKRFKKI